MGLLKEEGLGKGRASFQEDTPHRCDRLTVCFQDPYREIDHFAIEAMGFRVCLGRGIPFAFHSAKNRS